MTDLDTITAPPAAAPSLVRDEITHRALALCAETVQISRARVGDQWQVRVYGVPILTSREYRLRMALTALQEARLIRWVKPHKSAHLEHPAVTDAGREQLAVWDGELLGGDT